MNKEDRMLAATLAEFLKLYRINWDGRPMAEAVMRARALQDLSALDTEDLMKVAAERTTERDGKVVALAGHGSAKPGV